MRKLNKKLKGLFVACLVALFVVGTPATIEAQAATEYYESDGGAGVALALKALLGLGLGGGGTTVGAILYHKKVTTGLFSKIETLVWDKESVKIVDSEYVKTYKTTDKDFYASKK